MSGEKLKTQGDGTKLERDKLSAVSGGTYIENGKIYPTQEGDMVSWCDADSGEYYYWHTIYDEEHGSLLFESDGGKETALLGTDRVTCLPKKIVQDGEIKYWNNLNGGDV